MKAYYIEGRRGKGKRDLILQWNPSIADTIGTNNYREVFLIQGLPE